MKAMVNTPVLALQDFSLLFAVETDASTSGVGDVLMQRGHPIAYMSKAVRVLNSKLSIYEKEFFTVIMAIDKWRQYLQRGPFVIYKDYKSLCNLEDQQHKAMTKLLGLHLLQVQTGS